MQGRRSQLDFAGTTASSAPAYVRAVQLLRESMVSGCAGTYVRPTARPGAGPRASGGTPLVMPPEDRLVAVEADKAEHALQASMLPFPRAHLTASASADLRAAVRFAVANRAHLPAVRSAAVSSAEAVAASLSGMSTWLAGLAAGSPHEHLVQGVHLAFIAAWCDAAEWPDVDFVRNWVFGFPIVGDIPDSGLFRPQETPASSPPSTFSPAANTEWTDEVLRRVTASARSATGDSERVLRAVHAQTRKEACKGYIKGPLTRGQLNAKFVRNKYRVMVRFGIEQGPDGQRKVRAIDNAKASLSNAVSSTHETIVCITFEFAGVVAALVLEECIAIGIEMLEMAVSFEDLTAAYRFVPTSQPQFTVFCVWRFTNGLSRPGPEFYYVPGHNFGMVSSVLNFNRFPKLMVAMARSLLALPVDQYFDDYCLTDLKTAGDSGQVALQRLHLLVNRPLDKGKRQLMADARVGLGVNIDVSRVRSEWALVVSTKWHRCLSILTMLREARRTNHLTPAVASTVYGKLGFVFTAVYGRVGRAASQPLVERIWNPDTMEFTPAMRHMLLFYEALLPNLPPLRVSLHDDGEPPIVVYTDASYQRDRDGGHHAYMGYQIIDPANGMVDENSRPVIDYEGGPLILHRGRPLSAAEMEAFATDKKTLIMQAEIAAATWVYYSNVELFRGRRVIHFIDNTGALSAMLHGYARKLDCARMVNSFHLLIATLRLNVYFEWVPSEANPSDLPSRELEDGAMALYLRYFPTSQLGPSYMPPLDAWLPGGAASLASVFAMYGMWSSESRM